MLAMDFNEELLDSLADLCRIEYKKEKKEKLLAELKHIVQNFDELDQIDTEGVTPCNTVLKSMQTPMREDLVKKDFDKDTFIANSPSHVGGMIKVPPVIKFEE